MKWVSVQERLPKHEEPVIICYFDGYVSCYAIAEYYSNEFHLCDDMLSAYNYDGPALITLNEPVTHWADFEKIPEETEF